jgi:hypothetical protein
LQGGHRYRKADQEDRVFDIEQWMTQAGGQRVERAIEGHAAPSDGAQWRLRLRGLVGSRSAVTAEAIANVIPARVYRRV